MDGSSGPTVGHTGEDRFGLSEEFLEARYFEFCSARLTDALLSLSPDEIFLLAQSSGPGAPPPSSWEEKVQRATDRLAGRLPLPTLEEFAAAYREDPRRFDAESLGLWERRAGT
jgi:hypothetical protein